MTDGTRSNKRPEVSDVTEQHRAVLELGGVQGAGVDQARPERRIGHPFGEIDQAAVEIDLDGRDRLERQLTREAVTPGGVEYDPARAREGALQPEHIEVDVFDVVVVEHHPAPAALEHSVDRITNVSSETFQAVEHGDQRLDDDLSTGVRMDQLTRHHHLAGERAELPGENNRFGMIVAAIDGDHQRHPEIAQQCPHRFARLGVGLLGLGIDHVDHSIDIALEDVGHEPEAALSGGAEQQQPHATVVDRVGAEVHGDRGAGLDARLVTAGVDVGLDDRSVRNRLDQRRLSSRERAGDQEFEHVFYRCMGVRRHVVLLPVGGRCVGGVPRTNSSVFLTNLSVHPDLVLSVL